MSVTRTRSRRFAILGIVIAVIVVAVLAARPLFLALVYPSSRLVSWELHGVGGPQFDPAKAQTTTMVPVGIWWPHSAPPPPDASWLEPIVDYTPWSVTITLHAHFDVCGVKKCVPVYLSPISVPVYLSEPLGGRALFDGSTMPPAARPYP
jgi:hypothetical protein